MLVVGEFDELADISSQSNVGGQVLDSRVIQLLHGLELVLSNAYNNHGPRQVSSHRQESLRLFQVVDYTVGKNQLDGVDVVLLVLRSDFHTFLQRRHEQSGTAQSHLLQRLLVRVQNAVKSQHRCVLLVSSQRETVVRVVSLQVRVLRNTSETEQLHFLVVVESQKNVSHSLQSCQILVFVQILAMERSGVGVLAIGSCEVDVCDDVDLLSSHQIIDEGRLGDGDVCAGQVSSELSFFVEDFELCSLFFEEFVNGGFDGSYGFVVFGLFPISDVDFELLV